MEDKYNKETKSGFVGAIVNAFDGFVSTFKKHGLLAVTFILVLFLLFYSFILHPININEVVMKALEKNDQIKIEQQQKSIEQRLEADKLIMDVMENLVSDYGVERVMLFEMHNSTQNLSGVEFLYMSCSYEVLDPNNGEVEYISDNFQKQYLTNFIGRDGFSQLKHKEYLYYPNLAEYHRNTYRFINKMKKFDAKSVMLIPFCSEGRPLLVMVIASHNPTMDAESIYNYVKKFKSSIEKNLMSI